MAVNFADAIKAFNKAASLGGAGMEPRETPKTGAFLDLVKEVTEQSIETTRKAEEMSAQAVRGKAELADVVTAVANAELTLQTVVAVRDRILAAYQEIIRMPI